MDDNDTAAPESGPSRRATLRMGAAVAWTVPVMTAIGTTPAHADTASGPDRGVNPPPKGGTPPSTPGGQPPATTTPPAVQGAAASQPTPAAAGAPQPRVAAAGATELARTGAEAATIAVAGAGLVAGGAALYAASKRLDPGTQDDLKA